MIEGSTSLQQDHVSVHTVLLNPRSDLGIKLVLRRIRDFTWTFMSVMCNLMRCPLCQLVLDKIMSFNSRSAVISPTSAFNYTDLRLALH